jgi:hypothetical protein
MDILFDAILSALAVAYLVELVTTVTDSFLRTAIVKGVLTLPLAFIANWFLDITGFTLVIAGLASAFLSLAFMVLINRAAQPVQVINRR